MRIHTSSPEPGSFDLYTATIQGIVGDTTRLTLIDLCCGELSHVAQLPWKESMHVDVLDWPTRPKVGAFIQGDAVDVLRQELREGHRYDVALCSDGIEHMLPQRGFQLLARMATIANTAIIFTPMGNILGMNPTSMDPHQHKSAWMPDDFVELGWNVAAFGNWHFSMNAGAFFAWTHKDIT